MEKIDQIATLCRKQGILCKRDEPLSRHTTFHIGGPAALFCECENEGQIAALLQMIHQLQISSFVLGRGSNVLFADEGFPGVVLHIGKEFGTMELAGECAIVCQSGARLSDLCEFARENGLSGLEFAYGIPGSVGGAAYMNAGAYGGEMRDVLLSARHVDYDGTIGELSGGALGFSYRSSAYEALDAAILSVRLQLQPGNPDEISAKMKDYMFRRRDKQPLEFPSAGSTFKRPQGGYASELIDRCGLKGAAVGGAQVSEKHAGFVVNRGGATARDVLQLIECIQQKVLSETGILLEPEVRLIGGMS